MRDESTDDIRVVIELKSNAQPHRAAKCVVSTHSLKNLSLPHVGLLNGVPQTLTLHQLLQAYIDHRRIVVDRATVFDLERAKDRAHIVEG